MNHFIDIKKSLRTGLTPKQVMVTRAGKTFRQTVYVNLTQPAKTYHSFKNVDLSSVVAERMKSAMDNSLNYIKKSCPKLEKHPALTNFHLTVRQYIAADNGRKQLGNAGLYYSDKTNIITVVRHKIHDSNNTPIIGGWRTGQNSSSTFRHELGHHIWYKVIPVRDRNYWKDLFKVNGKPYWNKAVSGYGATDHEECFAESFAAYTASTYKKGLLPAEVEDFMDGITKGEA